ncbi:MAG: lamin tail domain-containing protein [Gammaproteobacteria bacterium]
MKKKTKTIGVLLTGIALAVGIAVSGGVFHNSHIVDETLATTTYLHTIGEITWSAYGVQELSGIDWTASATGGAYWGYDATKGQQFGSSKNPAKSLTLSTSGISGSISSVSISTSGASDVAASIGVSVGGSQYGGSPISITESNAKYTFSGNATGDIIFTWTQTSSKALYLKTIEIAYSEGAPKILSSIAITGDLSKTAYYTNDSWSPAGLTVTGTYDDSTTGDVTDDVTWSFNPATPNNTSISSVNITAEIGDILDEVTKSVTVNEAPAIAELFISEYIEGDGNNKAIEIYNGTGASVSLSNYKLRVHANGATSTTNITLGEGTLANNDVYVIANGSANATILNLADSKSGSITFNGDDAVSLFKVSTSTNIDVIGTIGSDPGSKWTGTAANGAGSTLDTTLVRTTSTFGPNSTFTWSEWNAYAQDTFSYLGSHTVITSTPQHELDARTWGAGFLSATSSGCTARDQDALSTAWNGLETSYNALSSEAKGYLTSLTPNEAGNDAEHAVARYIYIITKYGDTNFNDFMNLNIQSAPSFFEEVKVNNLSIIIVVIIVTGLSVLLGYYYLNKKKEA